MVVGRSGDAIIAASDDDARPRHRGGAPQGLHVAHLRDHHHRVRQELPDRPARRAQMLLPNVTSLDGGLPIRLGNDVIGGGGVAGSPGKDEQCASAGLDKVKAALQ